MRGPTTRCATCAPLMRSEPAALGPAALAGTAPGGCGCDALSPGIEGAAHRKLAPRQILAASTEPRPLSRRSGPWSSRPRRKRKTTAGCPVAASAKASDFCARLQTLEICFQPWTACFSPCTLWETPGVSGRGQTLPLHRAPGRRGLRARVLFLEKSRWGLSRLFFSFNQDLGNVRPDSWACVQMSFAK